MEKQHPTIRMPRLRKRISAALLALAAAFPARAGSDWQTWLDQAASRQGTVMSCQTASVAK